jgi:YVTN family beta-propeller protein
MPGRTTLRISALAPVAALALLLVVSPLATAATVPQRPPATAPIAPAASLTVKSTVLLETDQVFAGNVVPGFPDPQGLAIDPVNDHLYVADGAGIVWVEIASTQKFVNSAHVLGGRLTSIAIDPQDNHLFVVDQARDLVHILNASTGAVLGSVATGSSPYHALYDPGNGRVYVTNSGSANLTVIDGSTDAVVGSVPAGSGPTRLAYDSRNGRIFVSDGAACPNGGPTCNITVVDPTNGSIVATVGVGGDPLGLAFDNQTGTMFVGVTRGSGGFARGQVTVLGGNTSKVITSISLGPSNTDTASDLAFDYRNRSVFVPEPIGQTGVINASTHRLVANESSDPSLTWMVYDGVDNVLAAISSPPPCCGSASVGEYDPLPWMSLGGQDLVAAPSNAFYNGYTHQLFSIVGGGVVVYNSNFQPTSSGNVAGIQPQMAYNPGNGQTYFVTGTSVYTYTWPTPGLFSFPDPHGPSAVAFDSKNGDLYVANYDGNLTVYHRAGSKLVATLNLENRTQSGAEVLGVAYDAINGMVYASVGTYSASSCTGTNWIVAVNATTNSIARVSKQYDSFLYGQIAIDGSAGHLFVLDDDANCGQGQITVYDTSNLTVATSLLYSRSAVLTAIAFDLANKDVYVTTSNNLLEKVGGATLAVLGSVSIGTDPLGVCYDGVVGAVVTANYESNTFSVVTP